MMIILNHHQSSLKARYLLTLPGILRLLLLGRLAPLQVGHFERPKTCLPSSTERTSSTVAAHGTVYSEKYTQWSRLESAPRAVRVRRNRVHWGGRRFHRALCRGARRHLGDSLPICGRRCRRHCVHARILVGVATGSVHAGCAWWYVSRCTSRPRAMRSKKLYLE